MPIGDETKPTSNGDIFQGLGGTSAAPSATATPVKPSDSPSAPNSSIFQGLGGEEAKPPVNPAATNAGDLFAGLGGTPQTGPIPKFPTEDPNMPWYERAWDWANTPLVNFNSENKGGFTGGTEDVLSGLTSPLSLGLTALTFGGGAVLRGLGLAAEELPIAVRGIKALVDAGFTAQGAIQAAKESPRVLDALKEGDYDTAKRLAVHVLAGGVQTGLGAAHFVGEDLPMINPLLEKAGVKFRISDENLKLRREEGVRQKDQQSSASVAQKLKEDMSERYKDMSPEEKEGTMYLMQAGLNRDELITRHNMLAEAMGRPEERVANKNGSPETGPKFKLGTPTLVEDPVMPAKQYPILLNGEVIGRADVIIKEDGAAHIAWLGPDKPTGPELKEGYGRLSNQLGPAGIRELARQFKRDNPEIKTIEGIRIGGSAASVLRPPVSIPIDKVIGSEAEAVNSVKLPHPDEANTPEEQARYKELVTKQLLKEKYSPEEQDALLNAYKKAIDPTDQMSALAREARDKFDEFYETANQKGLVGDAFKNYITQIWENDPDNPAANSLMHAVNGGYFDTKPSFGRQRLFKNAFEGQLLGRKLAETNPITLVTNYAGKMGEAIANRDFLERITGNAENDGLRASDGRPATALAGTGKLVEEDGENPALLLNPNGIRNIRIKDAIIEALKNDGKLDKLIDDHTILELKNKKGEPLYAWNTQNYRAIDHSAFSNWNFGATGPDGTPAFVKSELRVHPEYYDYLNNLIKPESSGKIIKAALKVGGTLKHTILSLSPFHIAQEGLRAIMTGVNPSPFGLSIPDIVNDPMLRLGAEEGATFLKDRHSLQDYQEGVGSGPNSLLKNVPILKDIQAHIQHFLFDKYIPALKERAFKALLSRYAGELDNPETFGKLLEDRPDLKGYEKIRAAARLAAEDTNERFGGLNYRQFGRTASTQDFLKLATLAPDWLESEMRFTKRLFTPGAEGSIARADFAKMAAGMWAAARVLNLITNGKPHLEAPFGIAVQDKDGKEKIYSMRTLPTDVMHAISDPAGFVKGRISPLGRMADEIYSGRDFYGRKQTGFGTAVDVVRNVLPIPAQAIGGAIAGRSPELGSADQLVKAAGGTAQVYRTTAQTAAAQLASDRSESGPVDPAQLRKHIATIEMEDRIRSGAMPITDLHGMVEKGAMPVKDAKNIIANIKETQGMDPELARLYSRASRLPMKDFIQVWDLADNNEKAALTRLFLKKKAAYFKKAAKDFTPDERTADPTYQRLRRLFPQAEPW